MSSDAAWEEWGRKDPYFGVMTHPGMRKHAMTAEAREVFFKSGATHVEWVMAKIHAHVAPGFQPRSVFDFGCGVARLLIPFARIAPVAVGADISPSMLEEGRRNCDERGVTHAELVTSDDSLSAVTRTFDLVHTFIVLQHIPTDRGRALFARLLNCIAPGGVGALHLTYAKAGFAASFGLPPDGTPPPSPPPRGEEPGSDPEMQMNSYRLNDLFFLLQSNGVERVHVEFTDHGGELGVFLLFRR